MPKIEYTSAIGEAAEKYFDSVSGNLYKLPAQFRWADAWGVMQDAATPAAPIDAKIEICTADRVDIRGDLAHFVYQGVIDLAKEHPTNTYCTIDLSYPCVYATSDAETGFAGKPAIVGCIVYYLYADKTAWVVCGSVDARYRQRHIYTKMWDTLVSICQDKDISVISGGTSLDNQPMRQFYKKHNRVSAHVLSTFVVPEKE